MSDAATNVDVTSVNHDFPDARKPNLSVVNAPIIP